MSFYRTLDEIARPPNYRQRTAITCAGRMDIRAGLIDNIRARLRPQDRACYTLGHFQKTGHCRRKADGVVGTQNSRYHYLFSCTLQHLPWSDRTPPLKNNSTETTPQRTTGFAPCTGYRLTAFRLVVALVTVADPDACHIQAVLKHVNRDVVVVHAHGVGVDAGEPSGLAAL